MDPSWLTEAAEVLFRLLLGWLVMALVVVGAAWALLALGTRYPNSFVEVCFGRFAVRVGSRAPPNDGSGT